MKRRELINLEKIGITDEIRALAHKDRGEEKIRKYWREDEIFTEYRINKYMVARVTDGILKLEIYYGKDIRNNDEEPRGILFLHAKENKYDTYLPKEKKWSRAKLENLRMMEYSYKEAYKIHLWCSEEDADTIRRYLDENGGAWKAINSWQTKAMHRKEIAEIDRVMGQITETPADFGRWVREEAFWGQQYLFYSAKEKKAYCTACGRTIPVKMKSIHNRRVVCPECGRKVMAKSWNKQKYLSDRQETALIQRIPEGIIARIFSCMKVHEISNDWKARIDILETDRKLYNEKMINIRDYEHALFKQTGILRWCNSQYINLMKRAVVYPGNIKEIREEIGGLDAPIEEMLKREKGRRVGIQGLLRPGEITKNLIRTGLTKLAIEGMEGVPIKAAKNEKTAQEVLKINGDRINRLKSMNGGAIALGWLQYEQATGKKISQKTLERLEDRRIGKESLGVELRCGVTPERALNYIEKQPQAQSDVLTEWRDYLEMAIKEHMDVRDDIVRLPKNLRRRHNELVELRNKKEDEKKLREYRKIDREIRKHIREAAVYYWRDKNYMIVPAAKCEELMAEGRTLHHCVGASDTYMKKMAAGRTWILFLRKKVEPEIPYYTIEISMADDRILQWYSKYDRQPDRGKIEKVLRKFKKSVEDRRKKEQIKSA